MITHIKSNDRLEWILGDYEVNYLHLDYRFGFDLLGNKTNGSDGYLRCTIEIPFLLRHNGVEMVADPENPDSICEALQILHKQAQKIVVLRNGTLEVLFQDGLSIRVDKSPEHESWEASGKGELSDIAFLCSPHPEPPWME